jgi:hypothetical protein
VRLVMALGATLLILLGWESAFPSLKQEFMGWIRGSGGAEYGGGGEFDWESVSTLILFSTAVGAYESWVHMAVSAKHQNFDKTSPELVAPLEAPWKPPSTLGMGSLFRLSVTLYAQHLLWSCLW